MKTTVKRARNNGSGGIGVYDMLAAPWTEAGKAGVSQKVVRVDREVDLRTPAVAKKQEERPATAPTLRRPGEEMPESSPAIPSSTPPTGAPQPPVKDPNPNRSSSPAPARD